jgi:3,4-dihydroxy-2-butanone 4-phosphate synthase
MALTAKQRNALPPSAFVYPSRRAYPVPTKAQARKAGISERQRIGIHRSALSRAAQRDTMGTPGRVRAVVARRAGGKIQSVKSGRRR